MPNGKLAAERITVDNPRYVGQPRASIVHRSGHTEACTVDVSSLAARPSQKFRYERGKIGKIERAERFSVDGSGPVVAGGEQADESLGASNIAREQHRRDCCIILQR